VLGFAAAAALLLGLYRLSRRDDDDLNVGSAGHGLDHPPLDAGAADAPDGG
jgi:hypothetical protein